MTFFAALVLFVIIAVFLALLFTKHSPDIILLTGLGILILFGGEPFVGKADEFTIQQAFSGLTNAGVLTIAALFIVAGGIRETGSIYFLISSLLGYPKSLFIAQLRLMLPVSAVSGFINNTPLVAVLLPMVADWSKKIQVPLSKLLIPLSYAAILGGVCTLIGTSTNLLVYGELSKVTGIELSFFEISKIGIPCAIAGLIYLIIATPFLLPDRSPAEASLDDPRQYTLEMVVENQSAIVGKTIEDAGLRHLPGLYLVEIERTGKILPAVSPVERLESGDRLVFAGVVDSVVDVQKIPGLKPAPDQTFKLKGTGDRVLIEAVVSHQSPMIGKSIREGQFRTTYNAVVIAVARDGERVKKKIGDIFLEAGDMLLLEAHPSFIEKHRTSRDFYLLSQVENFTPPRHDKAWVSLTIFAVMLVLVFTNTLTMFKASMAAAGAMVLSNCVSLSGARKSIDYRVLMTIVAALGIGAALRESGLANTMIEFIMSIGDSSTLMTIACLYVATLLISEFLTNTAAAGIMINFAFALAETTGLPIVPLAMVVMIGSSAAFATPFGYQTNMMIYGPGGYRFADYLKIGIPLDIIVGIVATTAIYMIYF